MIPSIKDAFSFSSGGGDIGLGDTTSANGNTGSTFGNLSGPVLGTVKDKSWLFGSAGQSTQTSEQTRYFAGAAAVIAVLGVMVYAIKGRK